MKDSHKIKNQPLAFEFHIAATVRNRYHVEGLLFGTNGAAVFSNFRTVRLLAYRMNSHRQPHLHVFPGELNAAGLIEEVFHLIIRKYEAEKVNKLFEKVNEWLQDKVDSVSFRKLMLSFVTEFPSSDVYDRRLLADDYLSMMTGSRHHTAITIEEMLMVYLAGYNPAAQKLKELFDTQYLPDSLTFLKTIDELRSFLSLLPPFGPQNQDLFTMLMSPFQAAPGDLYAQLEWIHEHWSSLLPAEVLQLIRNGQDLMKEDLRMAGATGPLHPPVPRYKPGQQGDDSFTGKSRFHAGLAGEYDESERFTPDTEWMPNVVMLAKNTYVWLFQLTQQYGRSIRTLNEVPDEELDRIASMNFNALWLIGVWERSPASQTIKHICGNPDAVASAYSLNDYTIATELGGEEAYRNLNQRAQSRGIRLAGDMVPNHTGISSNWVYEKPDFFIQSAYSPFPGYRFTGQNLSQNPDIEIRIDDGYYSRSDAAVVFQWIHRPSGHVRYIYHGNDGTMMPWNDTAQLNLLKEEVRQAVISKILEVAQRFSIIRFDAAMTLAKKHFARLWYPEPGSGGDIPSRADYAMTRQQFDEFFPVEFWREVVDRINQHMPQTLLLAEAFWLMEGYFVRTLGMHRVYNSAFMHMLKNEENNKYRKLISNTLEFEPEILKRYVNFMSNPDEETAIRQFGSGDKYFGICTLMVTLPGLPMFSHGQAEGFAEKYGMEYQRAYMNETVNQWLMDKHIKEIFPLTKKRYLWSDVEHFSLYDFHDDAGFINENVFAFTNRKHNERALVLYNNKYESATGKFFRSVPKLIKGRANRPAATITLAEALTINANNGVFYTFREHFSGLEFLRTGYEFATAGWHWRLDGFECRVFIDFAEETDHDGSLAALHSVLGGRGVPSIETERRKQWLWPVHESFEALIDPSHVDFVEAAIQGRNEATDIITDFEAAAQKLFQTISNKYSEYPTDNRLTKKLVTTINGLLRAGCYMRSNDNFFASFLKRVHAEPLHKLITGRADRPAGEEAALLLMVLAIRVIDAGFYTLSNKSEPIDEMMLGLPIASVLARYGRAFSEVEKDLELLKAICCYESVTCADEQPEAEVQSKVSREKTHIAKSSLWFDNPKVRLWIGVNIWQGSTWFVKENFNQFCIWMFRLELIELCSSIFNEKQLQQAILAMLKEFTRIHQTAEQSGYQFDRFLELLGAEK